MAASNGLSQPYNCHFLLDNLTWQKKLKNHRLACRMNKLYNYVTGVDPEKQTIVSGLVYNKWCPLKSDPWWIAFQVQGGILLPTHNFF